MGAVTTASPVSFRRAATRPEPRPGARRRPRSPSARPSGPSIADAEAALLDERRLLTAEELTALAALPDGAVMALAALAHQVRLAWCGPEVEVEGILSAKTGGCPEDCHFCSQSSRFDTPVKATPFLDTDEVLAAARETAALGASEFCIVLAVRGPDERTMQRILELVPLDPRGDRTQRRRQCRHPDRGPGAAPGRGRRPPLQPQRRDGALVLPRHRLDPHVGRAGRDVPTGQGRTGWSCAAAPSSTSGRVDAQRVELLVQLQELDPTEVPLNFLEPPSGHAPGRPPILGAWEAIRWIALFRLALPSVILRYAGGREVTLRDLQAIGMTAGINALIVGNYLTTLGRSADEDLQMLEDLRMPIGALTAAI